MAQRKNLERARELRRAMTEPERLLWRRLRNRRFGRFKFRRQVPVGPYIADFVCFACKLILELDGGQHTLTRAYDRRRTAWLETHGFRVLRIWNNQLTEDCDAVEESIWRELHAG